MVQTIAVTDVALSETMFTYLLEDVDTLSAEPTHWWHPRVKVVDSWLKDDANRTNMPDDGAEEMIRRHIQRGAIYPHAQLKCWKHILLELQDVPCFAARYVDCARAAAVANGNASPSRGKIRPGKELIILSDDAAATNQPSSDASPDASDELLQTATTATATNSTGGKKFSALSMAERQAEWLRKKQENRDAERSRQQEEKDRELTFQPKILRRATLGDRPTKDPLPPRPLQRSDTGSSSIGNSSARKLDAASDAPSKTTTPTAAAGPKDKAIPRVPPRSAGRRKKQSQLQPVPPTQTIEIASDLLASMKSELTASIAKGAEVALAASAGGSSDRDGVVTAHGDPTLCDNVTESTELATSAPLDNAAAATMLSLKSWSAQPEIGGRRVDVDATGTKARLVLQDAAKFELSSMYRKTDKKARRDGVALHMGRREDTFEEEVIAVLFDKEKVSELDAARWWFDHEHRFAHFVRALPKPIDYGDEVLDQAGDRNPYTQEQQQITADPPPASLAPILCEPSSVDLSMGQNVSTERDSSGSGGDGSASGRADSYPNKRPSVQRNNSNNSNSDSKPAAAAASRDSSTGDVNYSGTAAESDDRVSTFMAAALGRSSSSSSGSSASLMMKLFSAKRPSLPDAQSPPSDANERPAPAPVLSSPRPLDFDDDPFAEELFVTSPRSSASSRRSSVVMSPRTFEALDAEFKPPTLSRFRSASGTALTRTDSKARIARIQSKHLSDSSDDDDASLDSSSDDDDNVQDDEIEVNDWLDEPEDAVLSPKTARHSSFSSQTSTLHGAHSSNSLTGGPTAANRSSVSSSSNSLSLATWLSSPDDADFELDDDDEPVLTQFMQDNMPVYEVMKQVQLFRNLSQNQQEQVVRALKPTKFQDGEIIVQQGTRGSRFYMIAKGNAVVTKTTRDAKGLEHDRMVTHLHAGHYFGELALIYDDPRTATVRAIGDVELLYLTQEDFQRIGQVHLSLMLQQVPLLARLSAQDQDKVLSRLKPANFNDGEYIVVQGEEGTRFYMITRGEAVVSERATRVLPTLSGGITTQTFEKELTRLYEGHVFGEMSLIYKEPRTASVRAVGPVKCLYLSKEDFDKCLLSAPFQRFIQEAYVEKATRRAMRLRLQQRTSNTSNTGKDGAGKDNGTPTLGPAPTPGVGANITSASAPSLTVSTSTSGALPPPPPTSPAKATETRKLVKQRLKNGQKVVNKYVIKGDLGKGTFGRVKLCQCEDDSKLYAVKIMHKTFVQRMAGKEDQLQDVLRREVAIMKKLNHRNVVKLVEVIDDPSSEKMYLVQEYVQHNLMEEIKAANGLSEPVARKYMRDLLSGLHYLHFHKVIHRDIKPENILVSADGVAKIADFGTARMIMNESETLSGAKGTPAFMAPEMFDIDATYTGPSVDVWSLGATLYMMVMGHPPWLADNEIVLAEKVQRDELKFPKEYERTMEPHLKNLIQRMLTKDPALRPSLHECFTHDWITKEGSEPLGVAPQENDLTVSVDESERAIQNIPERIDQSLADSLARAHLLVKTRQQGGVVRTSSGHALGLGTPVSGQLESRIPTSASLVSTTSSTSTTSPNRSSTEEVSRVINAWRFHKRVHLMDGHKELSARSRELLLDQKRMAFSVDRAKVTELILPAPGPTARSRYPSASSVNPNFSTTSSNSSGGSLSMPPSPRAQSSPSVFAAAAAAAAASNRSNSVDAPHPYPLLRKRSSSRVIKDPDTGNLEGFGRTSFTSVTRLSDCMSTNAADESGERDSLSSSSDASAAAAAAAARDVPMDAADLVKRSLSRKKDFLMVTSEVFRDEDGDYQSRKILFQARDHDFSVASRVPLHTKSGRELGRTTSSQTKHSSRKSIGSSPFNNNSGHSLASSASGSRKSGNGDSSADEFNMDDLDCVQVTEVDDEDDGDGDADSRTQSLAKAQLARHESHDSSSSSDSDNDSVYSDVEGDVDIDATFDDLVGTPNNLDIVAGDDEEITPLPPPERGSSASNLLDFQSQKIVQVYVSSRIRENLTLGLRSGYAEAKMSRAYMEDKSTGIAQCDLTQYDRDLAATYESLAFFGVYDGHNGDDTAVWLQKELHHLFFSHPAFLDAPMRAIAEVCDTFDREVLDAQNRSVLPKRKRTMVNGEFGFEEDEEVEEICDDDDIACHLQPISFSGAVSVFAVLAKRKKRQRTDTDAHRPIHIHRARVNSSSSESSDCDSDDDSDRKRTDSGDVIVTQHRGAIPIHEPAANAVIVKTDDDDDDDDNDDLTNDDREPATTLYIANVGDCRAVLCTTDGVAVELTKDHKAALPEEKARIEAAGGFVHNGRLDGILAISRGFGDLAHKQDGHLIATPDIYERKVRPEDEFLLLASDGLFDVLSSQQCVNFIRRKLLTHGDVQLAAQEILLKAQQYFAHDNISVVIVALNQEASVLIS